MSISKPDQQLHDPAKLLSSMNYREDDEIREDDEKQQLRHCLESIGIEKPVLNRKGKRFGPKLLYYLLLHTALCLFLFLVLLISHLVLKRSTSSTTSSTKTSIVSIKIAITIPLGLWAFGVFIIVHCMGIIYRNFGHRAGCGRGEHLERYGSWQENSLSGLRASLQGGDWYIIEEEKKHHNHKTTTTTTTKTVSVPAPQFHHSFIYLEFDVQETYDNEVVVMHDLFSLARVIDRNHPKNVEPIRKLEESEELRRRLGIVGATRVRFEKLRVRDLTLAELQTLTLTNLIPKATIKMSPTKKTTIKYQDVDHGDRVPTLEEWLECCKEYQLRKPLVLEIKLLHSDQAKHKMLRLLANFRDTYMNHTDIIIEEGYDFSFHRVGVIAWPNCFVSTFGGLFCSTQKSLYWRDQFARYGFTGCYLPGIHYINCFGTTITPKCKNNNSSSSNNNNNNDAMADTISGTIKNNNNSNNDNNDNDTISGISDFGESPRNRSSAARMMMRAAHLVVAGEK